MHIISNIISVSYQYHIISYHIISNIISYHIRYHVSTKDLNRCQPTCLWGLARTRHKNTVHQARRKMDGEYGSSTAIITPRIMPKLGLCTTTKNGTTASFSSVVQPPQCPSPCLPAAGQTRKREGSLSWSLYILSSLKCLNVPKSFRYQKVCDDVWTCGWIHWYQIIYISMLYITGRISSRYLGPSIIGFHSSRIQAGIVIPNLFYITIDKWNLEWHHLSISYHTKKNWYFLTLKWPWHRSLKCPDLNDVLQLAGVDLLLSRGWVAAINICLLLKDEKQVPKSSLNTWNSWYRNAQEVLK